MFNQLGTELKRKEGREAHYKKKCKDYYGMVLKYKKEKDDAVIESRLLGIKVQKMEQNEQKLKEYLYFFVFLFFSFVVYYDCIFSFITKRQIAKLQEATSGLGMFSIQPTFFMLLINLSFDSTVASVQIKKEKSDDDEKREIGHYERRVLALEKAVWEMTSAVESYNKVRNQQLPPIITLDTAMSVCKKKKKEREERM